MDYLPLFIDLKQRPVLVVGGGTVATRKITQLLRAGAQVRVVAQTLTPELYQQHQTALICWVAQSFDEQQLNSVFLAIAATNDPRLNAMVAQAAERRQLLVNVVDAPASGSCIFPAIIDRSPLVVAFSSGGQSPALTRILREKLEQLLPASLGIMARIAGLFRSQVKTRLPELEAQRRFWQRLFNGKFARLVESGQEQLAQAELQRELGRSAEQQQSGADKNHR